MKRTTKEKILIAARDHFTQFGYVRASLESIARAVGIKKGSLYYFFRSKEDLYAAVFQETYSRIQQHLVAMIDQTREKALPLENALEQFLLARVKDGMTMRSVDARLFGVCPRLQKDLHNHLVVVERLVERFLRQYRIPQPKLATQLLISAGQGYVMNHIHCSRFPSLKSYCAYLARVIKKSVPTN